MFPYKDDNPTILTPYVTVGIIVVTSVVWFVVQAIRLNLIPYLVAGTIKEGLSGFARGPFNIAYMIYFKVIIGHFSVFHILYYMKNREPQRSHLLRNSSASQKTLITFDPCVVRL